MSKSAKGTVDNPGTKVKAKSGLNKALLEEGFLIKVAPKNTSGRCPKCSYIDKDNRMTQANFVCEKCGYSDNADVVGAMNVLRAGLAKLRSEPNQVLGQKYDIKILQLSESH